MGNILSALILIAQKTGRLTEDEVNKLYNRLWRVPVMVLVALFAVYMMNAGLGWKMPSFVLGVVLTFMMVYLWMKPLNVLTFVGQGGLVTKILTDASLAVAVQEALKKYFDFLCWVLLAADTFLFFTGLVSFQGNPELGRYILAGLAVIGLFIWKWPDTFLGTWGRKSVYYVAVGVVIVSLLLASFGPALWYKYTGRYPSLLMATVADEARYHLSATIKERTDAAEAAETDRVTARVASGEISPAEAQQYLAQVQQPQDSSRSKEASRPAWMPKPDEYWRFPSRDNTPPGLWPTWDIPPGGMVIIKRPPNLGIWVVTINGTEAESPRYNYWSRNGTICPFGGTCANDADSVLVKNASARTVKISWATYT